jgi:hypothetical protein
MEDRWNGSKYIVRRYGCQNYWLAVVCEDPGTARSLG